MRSRYAPIFAQQSAQSKLRLSAALSFMNIKAMFDFGGIRKARTPPIINLAVGLSIFFLLIPWLLIDGKFLLKKIRFRYQEQLLTIANDPLFFYALAFFAGVFGFFTLWGFVNGYRQNREQQKLNNHRQ
ncbi:hypothetical protein [Microbulbifer elongatus]|uniref:hypothetical protein n=1 Tax=Microbulbifer elongatus TaxID=86173 RepID=UPI001E4C5774|nr:hypothetical protein [Microbulbifer elongatus]